MHGSYPIHHPHPPTTPPTHGRRSAAATRQVPLLVVVNKRDVAGCRSASDVIPLLTSSERRDVCSAFGGRMWRVLDMSASTGEGSEEVAAAARKMIKQSAEIKAQLRKMPLGI